MSKLFDIIGLRHPGKVNLFQFGTVDLFNCSDEKLLKIYQADPKIKYLKPTAEGLKVLYPDQNEIIVASNPLLNNNNSVSGHCEQSGATSDEPANNQQQTTNNKHQTKKPRSKSKKPKPADLET